MAVDAALLMFIYSGVVDVAESQPVGKSGAVDVPGDAVRGLGAADVRS